MSESSRPLRLSVRWAALAAGIALLLTHGCGEPHVLSGRRQALLAARQMIVLPLTDAPSAASAESGWVVRGAVIHGLHQLGRYELINVSPEQVKAAVDQAGFVLGDCYDPHVAAAVGRQFRADAVACGELTHFGTRQERQSTTVLVVHGGGTETNHYVGVSLRIVNVDDAGILYTGRGDGFSPKGYASAAEPAVTQALRDLRRLCRQYK